jgi:hypothetical protein
MAKKTGKTRSIATPEFLRAMQEVFGNQRFGTWIEAVQNDDPRVTEVHVRMARDPKRWFAFTIENNVPRQFAKGDSEADVRTKLECAVADRQFDKSSYRTPDRPEVFVIPPDKE